MAWVQHTSSSSRRRRSASAGMMVANLIILTLDLLSCLADLFLILGVVVEAVREMGNRRRRMEIQELEMQQQQHLQAAAAGLAASGVAIAISEAPRPLPLAPRVAMLHQRQDTGGRSTTVSAIPTATTSIRPTATTNMWAPRAPPPRPHQARRGPVATASMYIAD
mmetsp:Transcript_961/g.1778  ORF Transcript_961/g.1778 Transcript_961/m.1778 type:complete len:165 (-) Transcript_961:64-558(-)